jgi:uncharacterized membrane protein
MQKNRLEALSDGIIAIIITIMVLELKVPEGDTMEALRPVGNVLLSYVLSFIYLGIYWNNHHHMVHTIRRITGGILWANLHLMFWLSLVPFTTSWLGDTGFAKAPSILYGANLFAAAGAYYLLQSVILRTQGENSILAKAVGKDIKGKLFVLIYPVGIAGSYFQPAAGMAIYALVAIIWFLPDRRIEHTYAVEHHQDA